MSGRFLLVGSAEEARRLRIRSVVEVNTCMTWEESRRRRRVALIADNSQILLPSPGCQRTVLCSLPGVWLVAAMNTCNAGQLEEDMFSETTLQ